MVVGPPGASRGRGGERGPGRRRERRRGNRRRRRLHVTSPVTLLPRPRPRARTVTLTVSHVGVDAALQPNLARRRRNSASSPEGASPSWSPSPCPGGRHIYPRARSNGPPRRASTPPETQDVAGQIVLLVRAGLRPRRLANAGASNAGPAGKRDQARTTAAASPGGRREHFRWDMVDEYLAAFGSGRKVNSSVFNVQGVCDARWCRVRVARARQPARAAPRGLPRTPRGASAATPTSAPALRHVSPAGQPAAGLAATGPPGQRAPPDPRPSVPGAAIAARPAVAIHPSIPGPLGRGSPDSSGPSVLRCMRRPAS